MSQRDYLLSDSASELERLRLQARVWKPEIEAWLDRLGPIEGWHCLDLGCGAMGILGPLSRRAGPSGRIVGVDIDPMQLRGARAFVAETPLANVEIIEADAYASPLPAGSFELTHVRFLFAPVGRDAQLVNELWRLTKPGGIIAIQEPDSAAWRCYPPSDAWDRLKAAILETFRRGGGDFDAGRRTYMMLRDRGAEDLRIPRENGDVQAKCILVQKAVFCGKLYVAEPELSTGGHRLIKARGQGRCELKVP